MASRQEQGARRPVGRRRHDVEVDWQSFAGDLKVLNWLEFNGPQQVVNAFRMIGTDDLGKEALRGAVKKVVVKNVPDENAKALAMDAGVFSLTCAFAKSPGGRFTHDAPSVGKMTRSFRQHLGK